MATERPLLYVAFAPRHKAQAPEFAGTIGRHRPYLNLGTLEEATLYETVQEAAFRAERSEDQYKRPFCVAQVAHSNGHLEIVSIQPWERIVYREEQNAIVGTGQGFVLAVQVYGCSYKFEFADREHEGERTKDVAGARYFVTKVEAWSYAHSLGDAYQTARVLPVVFREDGGVELAGEVDTSC